MSEQNSEQKYWMIHNPNNKTPWQKHDDHTDAVAEAKRLASKHPGRRFFVLETVDCYVVDQPEPRSVILTTIITSDDCPTCGQYCTCGYVK